MGVGVWTLSAGVGVPVSDSSQLDLEQFALDFMKCLFS